MATYEKHLDHIRTLVPKIKELPDNVLKPSDFYFIGWYGGRDTEDYEDEKNTCRFAVALKSTWDARGCWEDGEPESKLIQALAIPLFYESGCVYAFRNLMDTVSRLLAGQPQDSTPPAHTPQQIRKLFLEAGFTENLEIIRKWNARARPVTDEPDDDWLGEPSLRPPTPPIHLECPPNARFKATKKKKKKVKQQRGRDNEKR